MSWDIFSKSKIQYFLEKLKGKFVQKESGKGLSTNDYDNTDKAKVDKIDTTTTSISGNPISISGLKANQLAINPIITLEPIQAGSGTPSPSNIRAISGYDKIEVSSCGKNIFDISKVIQNSTISVSGNSISKAQSAYYCDIFSGNFGQGQPSAKKLYLPKGTYTVSYTSSASTNLFIDLIDDSTLTATFEVNFNASSGSFTMPRNGYVCIKIASNVANTISNLQIELGSLATTYEPYHKTTSISESLGQTVYGGSDEVRTGKFTDEWYMAVFDGSSDENWSTVTTFGGYTHAISLPILAKATALLPMSNKYRGVTVNSWTGLTNGDIALHPNEYNAVRFRDDSITSVEALRTALAVNPLQVCYHRGTNVVIQLTPHEISLLKDYAYVSTNGTNISLDYHNGELASLADVSQLGETVNELGEYVNSTENIASKITMASSALQNTLRAYKFGKVIHLCFYTGAVSTANTAITLGQVDSSLLNSATNVAGSLGTNSTLDFGYGSLILEGSTGNIKLIYSKTTTYSLFATITYVLK